MSMNINSIEDARKYIERQNRMDEIEEQFREVQKKVLKAANEELERQLVRALKDGYDYLDTEVMGDGSVRYRPWNEGNEPAYSIVSAPAERYDLRDVRFSDLRDAQ